MSAQIPALTLDAGALIAIDRRGVRAIAALVQAHVDGATIAVPATVLAQVLRDPRRQVHLMRFVHHPRTATVPLDLEGAQAVGRLLAISATSDVVDAHVVTVGRRFGRTVVTSDVGDLRRLDPGLELIAC